MKAAIFALVALSVAALGVPEDGTAPPTCLFEWISKTGPATVRLTLFTDRILVRKSTGADGKVEFKKRRLSEDEYSFYAKYFATPESVGSGGDFETGLAGDQTARSTVEFAPPDAPRWKLSFDSFTVLSLPAGQVKAALEGLRDSFGKVLPNESDFTSDNVVPGAVLRRRDGQEFRVIQVSESRVVEMKAVGQPYSQFFQWSALRYTFFPP